MAVPRSAPRTASAPRRDPRLDLNLLRVLDAIHTHGGISSAARVLHLSQPAISHALNRLREQFGDPLFVRQGNRMLPTERTRRLIGPLQAHLRALGALVQDVQSFDPAQLEMTFQIAVRDVLESITFPHLMQHLVQAAPGVTITSLRVPRQQLERELLQGQLDLAIERQTRVSPRIRSQKLAEESLVVVGPPHAGSGPGAPARGRVRKLATRDYQGAHHVHVTLAATEGEDALDRLLAAQGLQRHVALRCQHYFAACQVVAQTGWLLTMPRTYALELSKVLPIGLYEPPFEAPPIAFLMYWLADRDDDPAHRWLRGLVSEGAAQVMNEMNRRGSKIRI